MKNDHKKQLVNPDRVFRMLQKLKDEGSPHHQKLDTPEAFHKRCKISDKDGFELMFDDIQENLEIMTRISLNIMKIL